MKMDETSTQSLALVILSVAKNLAPQHLGNTLLMATEYKAKGETSR